MKRGVVLLSLLVLQPLFLLAQEPQESELDPTQPIQMLTSRPKGVWTRKHDLAAIQRSLDRLGASGYRVRAYGASTEEISLLLEKTDGPNVRSLIVSAGDIERDLRNKVCEAAANGYRLIAGAGVEHIGRPYGNGVVMEQVGQPQQACPYTFLSTQRTSTLEKEINEAAGQGYEVINISSTSSFHAVILEKGTEESSSKARVGTQRYKLLAVERTSTLQQEITEAAAAGYTVVLGSASPGEGLILLERAEGGNRNTEYVLLADGRPEILEEEINRRTQQGYRLLPRTLMIKPHSFWGVSGNSEIVVVLEKSPETTVTREYVLVAKGKVGELQSEVLDKVSDGFELRGAGSADRGYFAILDKELTAGAPHYRLGRDYLSKKQYDDAIAAFEKVLEVDPAHVRAYFYLGVAYNQKGLYDQSISSSKKAIELSPHHVTAHLNVGVAYRNKRLYDESLIFLKKAVDLAPEYPLAHRHLGWTYREQGLFDEAVSSLRKAVELEPDNPFYRTQLGGDLVAKGDYEEARNEYREAIRLQPDNAAGNVARQRSLAYSYFLEKRFAEAIKELDRQLEMADSPWVFALIWKALSFHHLGKHNEAQKVLEVHAEHFQGEEWQAYLFRFHQGTVTESKLLSRASSKGEQCEAYFYIGYQHLLEGNEEKAREYFQKTRETNVVDYFEYTGARARLEQLEAR